MAKIRFGLIGYGAWGRHHALAIQQADGCELRAVCARTPESREAAAAETGAAAYADFKKILSRDDLDVIDIVVPNFLHEEIATAALASGRHVLLEKPMATTVEACDRIIAAAREAGRLLLVGHEMRFSPLHARMHELIAGGVIGEPRYVLIDLWRRPYRRGSGGWRFDPTRVGNWTLEEPVHFFDASAWFLAAAGEPEAIYACGNRSDPAAPRRPDVNDNFTATVSYPGGAYAVISQTLAAVEHHLSIKVLGSRAMLRAEWHAEIDRSERPQYALELSDETGLKPIDLLSTPGEFYELREEIAALSRAVRDGMPLPITPEEARRAVLLCLQAQRSLETGGVVRLDSGSKLRTSS